MTPDSLLPPDVFEDDAPGADDRADHAAGAPGIEPEPADDRGAAGEHGAADHPATNDEPGAVDEPATADERRTADEHEPGTADEHEPGTADEHESADTHAAPAPATVAELIAATLRAAGVRLAFTVPGESFLPLLDALATHGIRIVATRHESGAAFAAEAYGQLTGRPAACLATRAVGAANLAIGIHTARADSTPMFALVGQVTTTDRGREAFQEADLVTTIGGLAPWAAEIDDPATAAALLGDAVRAAIGGRPGPVLLAIPEDVLAQALPEGTTIPLVRVAPPRPEPDEVRRVLHALAGARRPVILAGAGVLRARCSNDLARLAELLHVPVIASWRRGDVMPNDNPLYLGMAGYSAPATVQQRLDDADLIVALGTRLNEVTTGGYRIPRPDQRWIHVDVAPQRGPLPHRQAPETVVTADAKAFVRAALGRLREAVLLADPIAWRDGYNATDRAAWEAATVVDAEPYEGPGVHPGKAITTLRRLLPDDAIVTTDAGNFAGWAARGFRFRRPGTFLGPTSGAMGYGLPAAIAAAIVHRDRPVVALVGDGGLGMSLAELETAVREQARVIVVCFDNERYGTIRMHQDRAGGAGHATDLGPVDFAAIARAVGARGVRVETDAALEPALRTALAGDRPTLIQLSVARRWVSIDERDDATVEGDAAG